MLKTLSYSIFYQLLIFVRLKQALFFTLVFPVFLFIIFGSLWGADDQHYVRYLLAGIIGMTIASDGLFAIGTVIKDYYSNGLIKYLRKMPFNVLIHFVGLIISRVISLCFVVGILCIISWLIFDNKVGLDEIINYLSAVFIGLFIFSFVGLCISFSGIKQEGNISLVNMVYFAIIFTSNTYFPVEKFNQTIATIGDLFPLNTVLKILRTGELNIQLIPWLILPVILFSIFIKGIKFNR